MDNIQVINDAGTATKPVSSTTPSFGPTGRGRGKSFDKSSVGRGKGRGTNGTLLEPAWRKEGNRKERRLAAQADVPKTSESTENVASVNPPNQDKQPIPPTVEDPTVNSVGHSNMFPLEVEQRIQYQAVGPIQDATIASLKSVFPYHKILPSVAPHEHPIGATSRAVAEDWIYRYLDNLPGQGTIVDIGSSVNRHNKNGRRLHCLCPNVAECPTDASKQSWRLNKADPSKGLTACTHLLQDVTGPRVCDHVGQVKAFMAIHSIYYLKKEDVLAACLTSSTGILVSLHHQFDELFANLFRVGTSAEAWYAVSGNMVTMSVNGNAHDYHHSVCDWLLGDSFMVQREGRDYTVALSKKKLLDQLFIVEFKVVNYEVRSFTPASSFLKVLNASVPMEFSFDSTKASPGINALTKYVEQSLLLEPTMIDRIVSYGSKLIFMCHRDQPKIAISTTIYHVLRASIAGRPRNPDTLAALVAEAKIQLRNTKIPKDLTNQLLLPTAYLAFIDGVYDEGNLLSGITSIKDDLIDFNSKLEFKDESPVPIIVPIMSAATAISKRSLIHSLNAVLTSYLWWKRFPARYAYYSVGVAFGSDVLSGLLKGTWSLARWVKPATVPTAAGFPFVGLVLAFVLGLMYKFMKSRKTETKKEFIYDPKRIKVAICNNSCLPAENIDPDAIIDFKVDNPMALACKPQFGNYPVITLFNDNQGYRLPLIMASCHHNVLQAIYMRLLHDKQTVNKSGWDIRLYVMENWLRKLSNVYFGAVPYDKWLNRFPTARRAVLDRAHKSAMMVETNPNSYEQRNIFVKREHYCTAGRVYENGSMSELSSPKFKPRLISGPSDEYLTQTGPVTLALSNCLKQVWNGSNTNVCYVSGYTAEGLGRVFQKYLSDVGPGAIFVDNDCGDFDSCVRELQYGFEFAVYEHMGIEKKYMKLLRYQLRKKLKVMWTSPELSGKLMTIAKIILNYRRNSGDGNTSCGNTIVNACLNRAIVGLVFNTCKWMFLGDDMLCVAPNGTFIPSNDEFTRRGSELGFNCKVSRRTRYTVEFASGRFYPTTGGIVWGMKIGRVLAKTFVCEKDFTKHLDPKDAYRRWFVGVARGLLKDTSFIPILRRLIPKIIDTYGTGDEVEIVNEWKIRPSETHYANDETFDMLAEVYNLSPSEVLTLEDYICSCDLMQPLNHPLLWQIIDVDVPIKSDGAEPSEVSNPLNKFYLPGFATLVLTGIRMYRSWWSSMDVSVETLVEPQAMPTIKELRSLHGLFWENYGPRLKTLALPRFCTQVVNTFSSLLVGINLITEGSYNDPCLDTVCYMMAIGFAPIIEEAFKSMLARVLEKLGVSKKNSVKYASYYVGIIEMLLYAKRFGKEVIPIRILPLLMHFFVGRYSFPTRVILHFIYNMLPAPLMYLGALLLFKHKL